MIVCLYNFSFLISEVLEQLKEECFEAYPKGLIRYTMETIVDIIKEKKKEKVF